MPVIQLTVNQSRIAIDRRRIRKTAKKILSVLDCNDAEVSILVVDDEEMTEINTEHRQVNDTTDVLSFPMREGEFGDIQPDFLGDVVISAPTAQRVAELHDADLGAIMDLLLVHGMLHLVGLDHASEEEARSMDARTMELLTELGHEPRAFEWFLTEAQYRQTNDEASS